MGKINVANDKIVIENQIKKTEKIWKSKKFLHKFPSNRIDSLGRNGFHSLQRPADARRSADIIYRM